MRMSQQLTEQERKASYFISFRDEKGNWISRPPIQDTGRVWFIVSGLNLTSKEIMVTSFNGKVMVHVLNGILIYPSVNSGSSLADYTTIQNLIKLSVN